MGFPLPAGIARLYRESSTGAFEFIGEDSVTHTPHGGKVRINTGWAFDITGEWKRMSHEKIRDRVYDESFEIQLNNRGEDRAVVVATETLIGDWEVKKSSHKYYKKDARTLEFEVELSPYEEVKIEYTARTVRK